MKTIIKTVAYSVLLVGASAAVAGITTKRYLSRADNAPVVVAGNSLPYSLPMGTAMAGTSRTQPVDLTDAAESTVHGVVHIKSTVNSRTQVVQEAPDLFEYFFGYGNGQPRERRIQSQPQVGYGSGVILSKDGYIVTNNHVIEKADEIEVTLNDGRVFTATLVGADENTDLALVKIEGDEFPIVPIGNSDDLKLGEWVLAVGNPFNLESTVTAGVVSAKARKIGIYDSKESIESFIQTDAAINMGNSGGALVNVRGELVGINSALESPTGTYTGYGFAIPTTIVKKVVADLKEYGSVQRGILGIMGGDVSAMRQLEDNKDKDFGTIDGVYVSEVTDGSGAKDAGMKSGDIISAINGKKVKTMTELQETIAQFRPGDKVEVSILRDKKQKTLTVELKNNRGNTEVVKNMGMESLGATFGPLSQQQRRQLNLGYGLQVTGVDKGLFSKAGIKRGYIVLKINNTQIKTQDDIEKAYNEAYKSSEPVLFISGVYPSGRRTSYAIDLSAEDE